MINLVLSLLFFGLIFSCAKPVKKDPDYGSHIVGVSSIDNQKDSFPSLKLEAMGAEIGPKLLNDQSAAENQSKSAVVALGFGPGLMRSFAAIDLLRALERKNLGPHMLHAVDMGVVVAALYGFGTSLDMIEWHFFNFLHETLDDEVLSEEWFKKAESILLKDIAENKISESKITLIIPVYSPIESKIIYPKDLTIKEIFRAQFRYKKSRLNKREYLSPVPYGVYFPTQLRQKGADIIVGVDFIGENINFQKPDSFMHGVYGRSTSIIKNEKINLDYLIELNFLVQPLDRINTQAFRDQYKQTELLDKINPLESLVNEWQPDAVNDSFDQNFDLREDSMLINEDNRDE